MHAPRNGPFDNDPSYYLQAARHVARGDGLLTSVSLYLNAINPLPQPYDDYPLWPLVLGAVGSVIGLIPAANVLPQILFVVDLLLFYLLTNRLANGEGQCRIGGEVVDVGHLVALVIGLNFNFFVSTVDPYTEGLAFALAIGSFLLIDRRPAWSGVLAGLAVLARYQMAVVLAATALVLIIARSFRRLISYAAPALGVIGIWLVHVRNVNVRHATIPPWQEWVPQTSLGGRALHVLRGVLVAFNPLDELSLVHGFGPVVIVVALAIVWLVRERGVTLWAVALTGAGSIVALANFESIRPPVWVFGSRHGLAFLFLLIPALVVTIAKAPKAVRITSVVLAVTSIVYGVWQIVFLPIPVGDGLTGADRAMMRWLNENAPHATLLSTRAQELSVYGDERYHWTHCIVDPATTRLMLDRLPIEYVIVPDFERSCPFVRGLGDVLKTEAIFSDQLHRVYLLRVIRKMTSTGAPSSVHTATGL